MTDDDDLSLAEKWALEPEEWQKAMKEMSAEQLAALQWHWRFWARPKQMAPPGDWLTWVCRAGRGWGKTRTGTGWVHERAMEHAGRWIALVGASASDVRDYLLEGPGGILKNTPPHERPIYEPSKRRVTWPNGTWGTVYSSDDPDMMRGFSGDTALLDEFAKYAAPRSVWDALQFGMREASNDRPRVCITTTPRPLPILEEIEAKSTTVVVVGSSYENRSNLAPEWFQETLSAYEGTRLGRQEIYADMLGDVEGRVYSTYSGDTFPKGNIDPTVVDVGGEILCGIDFNVHPMSALIAQRVVDECHILDAIQIPSSNTEELAREIKLRYPGRRIIACPDPAGAYRHSSQRAGQTDFTILRNAGFEVRAPAAHCAIVDRINNTEAMLLQGGRRRIRIHPRAKAIIASYKGLCYKEGTRIPDKGGGLDHMADAADYLTWQEFQTLIPRGGVSFISLSI